MESGGDRAEVVSHVEGFQGTFGGATGVVPGHGAVIVSSCLIGGALILDISIVVLIGTFAGATGVAPGAGAVIVSCWFIGGALVLEIAVLITSTCELFSTIVAQCTRGCIYYN